MSARSLPTRTMRSKYRRVHCRYAHACGAVKTEPTCLTLTVLRPAKRKSPFCTATTRIREHHNIQRLTRIGVSTHRRTTQIAIDASIMSSHLKRINEPVSITILVTCARRDVTDCFTGGASNRGERHLHWSNIHPVGQFYHTGSLIRAPTSFSFIASQLCPHALSPRGR